MEKRIIRFVGEMQGGKDTSCDHVIELTGASRHRYSDPMNEGLARMKLETVRENQIMFSMLTRVGSRGPDDGYENPFLPPDVIDDCLHILRIERTPEMRERYKRLMTKGSGPVEGFGLDCYSKIMRTRCDEDPNPIVTLNGIRFWADIVFFKDRRDSPLLYVTAPLELRLEWAKKDKNRPGNSSLTLEKFRAHNMAPTEIEIPAIGATADFRIDNIGTKDELYAKIRSVLDLTPRHAAGGG